MKKNNSLDLHIYFFLILLSLLNFIFISISRIGFDHEILISFKGFLLFIFLIFLKDIFYFFKIDYFENKLIYFVIGLLIIFILNKINILFGIDISYLIYFIALSQVFLFIYQNFLNFIKNKILFVIFIFFSFWSCSAYYSNHFISPLMYEKIITGSWAHRDELFHSALSGMIKTYDVFSNGINGLREIYYHYFSHFFIAQLSEFLKTNTLELYSIIYPILVIPMFFYSFYYLCSRCIKLFNNTDDYENHILVFWLLSFIFFILPLPMYWLSENYQYLRSQSYNIGLMFLFICISISIDTFFQIYNKKMNQIKLSSFISLLILSLIFFALSTSKFSLLYFAAMSYLFFFLRLRLYKNLIFYIIGFVIFLISILIYYNIIYNFQLNWGAHGFEISYISRLLNNPYSGPYYKFLFPAFFYFFVKITVNKLYVFKNFKNLYLNNKLIDIEYLFYLLIILYLFPYSFTGGIQIYICYFIMLINLKTIINFFKKINDNY